MLNYIRREPARIMGLLLAVIALAGAFGLSLTDEQTAAIVAVVGAVLAIVGAETTRSQVTPVNRAPDDH